MRQHEKGSLEYTTTLDHHRYERSTRKYLSIHQDEAIYAIGYGHSASIYEDKEPPHRLDTIAVTERGLYVPKMTSGSHTAKLIPWEEFPRFATKKIEYDEKLRWIYLDGDGHPFAFYDDYPFWKGLFDGLRKALK